MTTLSSVRTYRFPAIDRVVHGEGAVLRIPKIIAELNKRRVFVITGRTLATKTPVVDALVDSLGASYVGQFAGMRQHAPKADIDLAVGAARDAGADCLIGIGGSSVTDATKIIALDLLAPHAPQSAMPHILVPTTLSAGEYTPASGMTGDVAGVKTYVVDPRMAPFAVVLDPAITVHTPMPLWLSTGIKSIDHACEMLWSSRAHPITNVLAVESLRLLIDGLRQTFADPSNLAARLQCQLGGWMSMSGVSNVQVYLSHTLGHQIGARWDVPHGVTSGITLPAVMRFLQVDAPVAMSVIARSFGVENFGLSPEASAVRGSRALQEFVESMQLPTRLRDVGAKRHDFAAVAQATVTAGSATGFAGSISAGQIEGLLDEMW